MPEIANESDLLALDFSQLLYQPIDDWYQAQGERLITEKRGRKPKFSNSEVMTLLLMMDFIPFPSENQFLGYIRANHGELFPNIVDQSQFNRRTRKLRYVMEEMRRRWATKLGVTMQREFLLDTKPLPVVGYKRSKSRSDFALTTDYGVCASRNLKYFGYKLVMLSTMNGIPVAYELVAANTDERIAADEVLDHIYHSDIYGDKGFIGAFWQDGHWQLNGNQVWTPKRANQTLQNDKTFDLWLNSVRERIEGTFNELQNTGRNLERLLRKRVDGLTTHVIAEVTSHTLKLLLRRDFGIDIQTFSAIST